MAAVRPFCSRVWTWPAAYRLFAASMSMLWAACGAAGMGQVGMFGIIGGFAAAEGKAQAARAHEAGFFAFAVFAAGITVAGGGQADVAPCLYGGAVV